jgi:hypothetical protein
MKTERACKSLLATGILVSAVWACGSTSPAGPGTGGAAGGAGGATSGGNGGSGGKKCIEDVECPSGQGCFRGEGQVSYCAPLCTRDSQCPDEIGCPSNQPIAGEKYCMEVGQHKDQGVCALYEDSAYDATNCPKAAIRCLSDTDSCYCYMYATPGDLAHCTPTTYPNATCCADDGYPQDGLCMCYQTSFGCEPGMHKVDLCN